MVFCLPRKYFLIQRRARNKLSSTLQKQNSEYIQLKIVRVLASHKEKANKHLKGDDHNLKDFHGGNCVQSKLNSDKNKFR